MKKSFVFIFLLVSFALFCRIVSNPAILVALSSSLTVKDVKADFALTEQTADEEINCSVDEKKLR